MRLTVRQMEVIHAVHQYRSMSKAAHALGISQPAVSLMLQECASRTGFPFFVHKHGYLQATTETLKIVPELKQIFAHIENANCLIDNMKEVASGNVRVATSATLADNLLAPASAEFRSTRPHIQISVTGAYDNASIFDQVNQEQVDLGVVLWPLIDHEGRTVDARLIDICSVNLVCIVHTQSPLAKFTTIRPSDLLPYPLISFAEHLPLGALIEKSYRQENVKRSIDLNVTSTSMAYSLVRARGGVAIVDPLYQLSHHDDSVVTIPFEPQTEVKIQILLPTKSPVTRAARLFIEALRKHGRKLQNRVTETSMTETALLTENIPV